MMVRETPIAIADPKDIAATKEQVKQPAEENKAMGGVPPPACEEMNASSNSGYGGRAIYINTGTAPQLINNGGGMVYNISISGDVHTMFSGKES